MDSYHVSNAMSEHLVDDNDLPAESVSRPNTRTFLRMLDKAKPGAEGKTLELDNGRCIVTGTAPITDNVSDSKSRYYSRGGQ